MSNGQAEDISVIAPYLATDYAPSSRIAAALAYAFSSPQTLPPEALSILAAALRRPDANHGEEDSDSGDGQFAAILAALLRLPRDAAFASMVAALPELAATVAADDCLAIMLACFGIAWFGDGRLDYGTGWRRDNGGQMHIDIWRSGQTKVAREQIRRRTIRN